MLAVARIDDTFVDTDVISSGSGDVFVNTLQVARLTDSTTGHGAPGHTFYPPSIIDSGSGLVFVNNLPVARMMDSHAIHCDTPHPNLDCHTSIINSGSDNVFVG